MARVCTIHRNARRVDCVAQTCLNAVIVAILQENIRLCDASLQQVSSLDAFFRDHLEDVVTMEVARVSVACLQRYRKLGSRQLHRV
jgi:hypothetical protein